MLAQNENLAAQLRDLRVIHSFASTLLHFSDSIDDILWDLAQQAVAHIGLEDCVIYLLDEDRGDLVQKAAFGPKNPDEREIVNRIRLAVGQGIVGACAATGEAVLVDDTRLDPRYVLDDASRHSELSVPIWSDGRVIGVIDSEHSQPGFFTAWHVEMFRTLAAMTAGRLASARLERKRLQLATSDHLTGLLNREAFFSRLEQIKGGGGAGVYLMLINVDRFSSLNEWVGHEWGDEILKTLAARLRSIFPGDTPVARLWGDEFALLVRADQDEAETLGRKVLDLLGLPLRGGAIQGLRLSARAGMVELAGAQSAAETLVLGAIAMFEARGAGSAGLRIHDEHIASQRRRVQKLERDLERDLQTMSSGVVAWFQPIVGIGDRRIRGAEVLARWRHEDWGWVSPAEFVHVAEASGQVHVLGETVLRSALESLETWGDETRSLIFNINVSPLQIQSDLFVESLLSSLDRFNVMPEQIACEVTESALLADDRRTAKVFARLRERGVRLVLDDFGTGYASLDTLTRFPFSGVKIDRRFVENISASPRAQAIVRSVITLSSDLGLRCTAEGIETDEQLEVLAQLGCSLGQGWVFARAMPASEFGDLLRSGLRRAA